MNPHIYAILNGAPDGGVIVAALRTELSVRMGRAVGEVELKAALTALKGKDHLTEGTDDVTGDPTVALTKAGRAAARRVS